jgi:CRISPR/Cas system endoribonuclease Cas6 (RAMP superfamily)
MRIIREGVPIREFACSNFLRSLLRRISSLTYHYYSCGHDFDDKRLAAASSMIEVAENKFYWIDQQKSNGRERLSGIVGSGNLEGRLETEFHIFLLLGEYFHVGKGAAFGLGRYRIEKGPGAQSG